MRVGTGGHDRMVPPRINARPLVRSWRAVSGTVLIIAAIGCERREQQPVSGTGGPAGTPLQARTRIDSLKNGDIRVEEAFITPLDSAPTGRGLLEVRLE